MKKYQRRRLGRTLARTAVLAVSLALLPSAPLAAATASAPADTPANVPYRLPVQLPATTASPSVDAYAPYTPAVLSLIAQLEPGNPPTQAELANADAIVHGAGLPPLAGPGTPTCHNVGPAAAPAGTTPSIMPICWTDAQGVNVTVGPNFRQTTAPMDLMGLGSSFDRALANVWGQTEGKESRELMVTGLFGPQTDLDRLPNWGRNLTTTGEDPYLSNQMVAAQINGMQGVGTMSEMKHFVVYNGQNQDANTDIQDQALHELYLTPYEGGFVQGRAAAAMCSYQIWRDTSANSRLSSTVSSLSTSAPLSPYASAFTPRTWPLNESHYSCEQPLSLDYVLRNMWGSQAMVGTDYGASHSASEIIQGTDQEMPQFTGYLSDTHTLGGGGFLGTSQTDPSGSTCADAAGNYESCSVPGATHVAGIPNNFQGSGGSGCPNTYGCALVDSVAYHNLPLSVFNQALARILYEEQRLGMLGCDQTPVAASCTNPGGIGGDRSGTAPLPAGPSSGATPAADLGTKSGDAAVVEKESEEGAVLLKNDSNALPITSSDLSGGVFVTGPGAEYTIADPTTEASTGYPDRNQISPLEQLKSLSSQPSAFTYVPALSPSGEPVPSSALSESNASVTGHLDRTTGPGSPAADATIDFTTVSGHGQLAPGSYTWTGYVYVPTTDTYTFRFQQSVGVPNANVTFTLDGTARTLSDAPYVNSTGNPTFFGSCPLPDGLAQFCPGIPGSPTSTGYTEAGLTNRQYAAGSLTGGTFHAVTITFNNNTGGPASFRFAYSRANGDIADAVAAAKGKKLAIVFVNDNGAPPEGNNTTALTQIPNPYGTSPPTIAAVEHLPADQTGLLNAIAAANPNTVVVLNTTDPVLTPWIGSVKSLLEMWYSSSEGGTSTARLLLGQADPSGHTSMTWPANPTDTIWAYNETRPLYPGDTLGPHLDRLNGGDPGLTSPTVESEGIYSGYRFFDKEGITPQFPFGFGLSYTTFGYSNLSVTPASDGGADVSFTVQNTGNRAGADAAQLYLGPPADAATLTASQGIQFAVRSLAQFDRVMLDPGQAQTVTLHVTPRQLSYWSSARQQWVRDPTGRTIFAGDADALANLPLQATLSSTHLGTTTCSNEALNATTIEGNLSVPAGSWCDLVDVTVTGNLQLQTGSGVRITSSAITGNLIAASTSAAADPQSAGTNVICASTIGRNLLVQDSNAASPWNIGLCGGNKIGGNVEFNDNAATGNAITGNTVGGNLNCQGNGAVTASNNTAGKLLGQCAS
jgi:beta-glucosidase